MYMGCMCIYIYLHMYTLFSLVWSMDYTNHENYHIPLSPLMFRVVCIVYNFGRVSQIVMIQVDQ